MPPPNDRYLDRVRKLLAQAEHPSTPPAEAEAMSEKAAELMARYAIDRAMVEAVAEQRTAPEGRTILVHSPYALPKSVLLSNVAAAYRVRTVIGGDSGDGRHCTLVGYESDLEVVELLFTSLLLQATTAMLAASVGQARLRAYRHAFLLGYADTVGRRIQAAQQRTEDAATSTPASSAELVLADRREAVDRAVDEMFPRLRSLRTSISDGRGLAAGQRAATRADLGAARRVGGSRRALR